MTLRFDAGRIREVLPHGGEWRLLESAEFEEGTARARVRLAGWGERLALPHLFLVEALAQLSGLALAAGTAGPAGAPEGGYLAALEGFELGAPPGPGATVTLESRLEAAFATVARFAVVARAGDAEVLRGALTIATR